MISELDGSYGRMDAIEGAGGAGSDLDAAVGAAVAAGLEEVHRLSKQVNAVFDRGVGTAERAASAHAGLPGGEFISDYTSLVTKLRDDAALRLARQRIRLSTFNLVLFGRTGAGKSSLIEALSSGDGQPISEGQSDWTTDVREVRWRSTRLVDTPGIAGWGRTMSRDDLEARAEKAVADADVVILCFDTQSQQDGEFSKIAEWVSRYGKPVVAVLNSRNARWRQPVKVGRQSIRRDLSRTVHEHASNIRDELALIDLPDVPIVALHAKRAAFARTRDPYIGPDAGSRQRQRDEYGPERLLAWSNLPALELLLSEGLQRYASQLRLGMLHEQARGLLAGAKAAAQEQHEQTSVLAEQLERGINDVLGLVGRPKDRDLTAHLAQLENLRGGFGTAGPGELLSHARLRVGAGLEPARRDALRRADHLIDTSFETRSDLSPEDFEREVLLPARTEAEVIALGVGEDLQRHLAQRLELVADDVRADLSAAVRSFEGARTTAGQLARRLGVALEVGSSLFGIGSSGFLLVALANSWNLVGWTLGAVAGVSIVGGLAFSFIGGKLRKRGNRDRVSSLSAARAGARRTVHDTFDHLERMISEDLARILSRAAHERLAGDVAQATALRRVAQAARISIDDMQQAINDLPEAAGTSHLLAQVSRDVQRRRFAGEPTAERLLWLGEDWCNDLEGLSETDAEAEAPVVANRSDLTDHAPLLYRIRSITEAAGSIPSPGAGAEWLTATAGELSGDPVALETLAPVRGLVNDTPPRVVLAGDYSTGKSSFVKRLLVDAGLGVPGTLDVAAQPKTATAEAFRWGDWEIVDTPGFQSSHRDHAAAAHEAVIGASLLIVLFNPNLVVGAEADLRSVLLGDRATGRASKLARTLFVINRSDELGIDPREDAAGYRNLCRRKELELAQALGSRHAEAGDAHEAVSAQQILCVASDPYGLVGDRGDVTRADYDRHRDWDGMDAMRSAITGTTTSLARNAVDLRILEGGALILGDLAAARRTRLGVLEATVRQRRLLLLDLDACLSAGRALHAAARDRLVTTCVSFVAALFDDVASTKNDDELQAARVDQLRDWANNPELQQLLEEWSNRYVRDQQEWREATSARVEARLTSVAFASAFPTSDTSLDVDHLAPEQDAMVQGRAVGGAKRLAEGAANASREGVTKLAHAFGHKFRPWGATKLTAKVNAAGGALGVALGAVEIYSTVRSVQREGDEERSASDRRSAILLEVRQKAEAFFDSPEPDAPGRAMADAIGTVQQIRDVEGAQLDEAHTQAAVLDGQIRRCEQQMCDALERLERPEP
jgi:predicted GTPase